MKRNRESQNEGSDVSGTTILMEHASIEDLIDSLTVMAEQNVILAKGIQMKVERLRSERERRQGGDGAGGRRWDDPEQRASGDATSTG